MKIDNKYWQTLIVIIIGLVGAASAIWQKEIHDWFQTTNLTWLIPFINIAIEVAFIYFLVIVFNYRIKRKLKNELDNREIELKKELEKIDKQAATIMKKHLEVIKELQALTKIGLLAEKYRRENDPMYNQPEDLVGEKQYVLNYFIDHSKGTKEEIKEWIEIFYSYV